MFWKVLVYVVLTFGVVCAHHYWVSVQLPDVNVPVSLRQFENDDDAARQVRQLNFFQSQGTVITVLLWGGFTVGFFGGDLRRLFNKVTKELSR